MIIAKELKILVGWEVQFKFFHFPVKAKTKVLGFMLLQKLNVE
jgi:hypothetical protein